jgi:hypothetical protein
MRGGGSGDDDDDKSAQATVRALAILVNRRATSADRLRTSKRNSHNTGKEHSPRDAQSTHAIGQGSAKQRVALN